MTDRLSMNEMKDLLNKCYDAIDQSKLGPFFLEIGGQKVMTQIAQNAFLNLLGSQLPHIQIVSNIVGGGMTLKEPGEDWKGEK